MKKIFIGLLFLFPLMGKAQEKGWSLDDCINYALANNISIKQSQLTNEVNEANLLQSKLTTLPNLNGSANHTYNFGRTIDPFTNQFVNQSIQSNSFSLNSGVVLFNGFQVQNDIKQQRYRFLAGEQDLEVMKNNISLSVANFYLQVLFAIELVNISTLQVQSSKAQLERTRVFVKSGRLAKNAELDLEAQLANDELTQVNSKNQLDLAYLNLRDLLQIPRNADFQIIKPSDFDGELLFSEENVEEIFNKAAAKRPEIFAAEFRLKSSKMALRVARGGRSPRLSMFGNLNTVYSQSRKEIVSSTVTGTREIGFLQTDQTPVLTPTFTTVTRITDFNQQMTDNFGQSFGFSLSVPIFNGWQTNSNIQRSKIGMSQNDLSLQLARNTLYNDIAKSYADLKAADSKYRASQKSLEAQRKSFEFSKERMDAGMLSAAEWLVIQNNLIRAESNLVQSKYEFIFRAKIMDFYKGLPLKL